MLLFQSAYKWKLFCCKIHPGHFIYLLDYLCNLLEYRNPTFPWPMQLLEFAQLISTLLIYISTCLVCICQMALCVLLVKGFVLLQPFLGLCVWNKLKEQHWQHIHSDQPSKWVLFLILTIYWNSSLTFIFSFNWEFINY